MVIVNLKGGLGNQMFQYAVGRHLADKLDTELKLDVRALLDRTPRPNFTFRDYELGIFNLRASMARPEDLARFARPKPRLRRWLHKLTSPFSGYRIIREAGLAYNGQVLAAKGQLYLDGYWQSERYFLEVADTIRRDFSFKTPPAAENQKLLIRIKATQAVSLHVRRGDFVRNQSTNAIHGACSPAYYAQAVDAIAKQVPNPLFFVFSDEIDWVKEAGFVTHPAVFVSHNQAANSWEDLRLMSQCRHHIIANSTFSWWGAWLNPNPAKIVIAPRHWFNPESAWYKQHNVGVNDIVPHTWIRI